MTTNRRSGTDGFISSAIAGIRTQAKRLIPPKYLGVLDHVRLPELRNTWGGPFNGQQGRLSLFQDLLQKTAPEFLVETGTYRATTTKFMAKAFAGPIYTIEQSERCHRYSRIALIGCRNVHLIKGESETVLPRLLRNELAGRRGLFYLDAHWGTYLPLRRELNEIFSSNRDAVVMIDDFCVPDDDGYRYDDYGPVGQLTVEYLSPILDTFCLRAFYPTLASRDETGAKRGCVVLATSDDLVRALCRSKLLRLDADPKECNAAGPNNSIE